MEEPYSVDVRANARWHREDQSYAFAGADKLLMRFRAKGTLSRTADKLRRGAFALPTRSALTGSR